MFRGSLVSNALKFTKFGEIQLHISLIHEDPERVELRFSVMDTGVGISPEEKEKLFTAFSQADTSTTRHYGGTGLGLAISQNLVGMMGGEIVVDSTPGEGSTFSFNARFNRTEGHDLGLGLEDEGLHVLVVSAHELTRQSLLEMTQAWHFDVAAVESAQAGLDHCAAMAEKTIEIDLIIFDGDPGDMTGEIFVQRLDEAGYHSTTRDRPKLIMLCAASMDMAALGQTFRIDAVLRHPLASSTLYDAIVELFKGKTGHGKNVLGEDFRQLGAPLSGVRVLLVEDNEINQQVASELMEQVGLQVAVANNGREAVGQAEFAEFDVILMDLQMPEMDGFHATHEIRKFNAEIPIIAMTAAAMYEDRQRCLDAGMNDHIAKPIEPLLLMKTLLRWVKRRPLTEVAAVEVIQPLKENYALAGLVHVPGIEIEKGLALAGGNQALYLKLLNQFHEQYRDNQDTLMTLAGQDDSSAFSAYVHTLKGVSGSIGALDLKALCEECEAALSGGQGRAESFVEKIVNAMTEVLESIAEYYLKDEVAAETDDESEGPQAALQGLNDVIDLLAENELVESEAVERLLALLQGHVAEANIDALTKAITGFDYEKAISLAKLQRDLLEGKCHE